MKNLFNKLVKKEVKSTIQKLEKNQLEKIVGGTESTLTESTDTGSNTGKITFKAKEGATVG